MTTETLTWIPCAERIRENVNDASGNWPQKRDCRGFTDTLDVKP